MTRRVEELVRRAVVEGLAEAQSARPPPPLLGELDTELLLALVWAGPFLTEHLRLLMRPHWGRTRVHERLWALERQELIAGALHYRSKGHQQRPRRVGKLWWITERGRAALDGHDRAPYRAAPPARVLVEHDSVVSATIAQIVARTRPILSGIAVFREMRVDDQRVAPIADSIVTVRTRLQPVSGRALRWTRQGLDAGERYRIYAIESDRATEDLQVIAEKARRYRALSLDASFLARYGGVCPAALWVAPSERRLAAIHGRWRQVWPDGVWLMTHDAGLRADWFVEYRDGRERVCTWLDSWAGAAREAEAALAARRTGDLDAER